jgi:hypothetical protein
MEWRTDSSRIRRMRNRMKLSLKAKNKVEDRNERDGG